ncbi:hypothetical protein [Hymenobacter sediminis]|uniref:hypothetical protein n=1 Tax=Hymenobacter sediminis TaxID=2218621 RepID=UPI00138FD71E|nr:hypothetical protein [Hymenobacter sediminis]
MTLDQHTKGVKVVQNKESLLFILDKTSQEILAVVRVDSSQKEVKVNAATVAQGLWDLLPAYTSLSEKQQAQFDKDVRTTPAYSAFTATVQDLLVRKQPIYATSPIFLSQLITLNGYILKTYLNDPFPTGGTGRRPTADDDFTAWIGNEKKELGNEIKMAAVFNNQLRSYVKATFTPLRGGTSSSMMLEPRPFNLTEKASQAVTGIPDNSYTLRLNQEEKDVMTKNQHELVLKAVNLLVGQLGFKGKSGAYNECISSITQSAIKEVNAMVFKVSVRNSTKGMLQDAFESAKSITSDAIKNPYCRRSISYQRTIIRFVAAKTNVFLQMLEVKNAIEEFGEMVPYGIALWSPINYASKPMQLYKGQHLAARLKVEQQSSLKNSYSAGEKIFPELQLSAQSSYANWEKAGFTVEWKIASDNGSIALAGIAVSSTKTLQDGSAGVEWTLPANRSGEALLLADVKDQEGDALEGSPIIFKVQVTSGIAILGKWQVESMIYNYYNSSGDLIDFDKDEDIKYIEFKENDQVILVGKNTEIDRGKYALDIINKTIIISGTREDDYSFRYNINNYSPTGFALITGKIFDYNSDAAYTIVNIILKK